MKNKSKIVFFFSLKLGQILKYFQIFQKMNSDLVCSVSCNGDLVALCSPDGVVKFYDTLTSSLKSEYSSSTHLQASCTCLSWSKHKKKIATTPSSKNKKVKTGSDPSIEVELSDLELIAIGTSQGSILLYSFTKADLHSQLVKFIKNLTKVSAN